MLQSCFLFSLNQRLNICIHLFREQTVCRPKKHIRHQHHLSSCKNKRETKENLYFMELSLYLSRTLHQYNTLRKRNNIVEIRKNRHFKSASFRRCLIVVQNDFNFSLGWIASGWIYVASKMRCGRGGVGEEVKLSKCDWRQLTWYIKL